MHVRPRRLHRGRAAPGRAGQRLRRHRRPSGALARPEVLLDDTLRTDPVLGGRASPMRDASRGRLPRAAGGRVVGVRRARPAAGRRCRRLHRSHDRRRPALRAARRRARRAEALRALEHGGADAHVRLGSAAPPRVRRKWLFNRALRSLVGSPLRGACRGARREMGAAWLHQTIRYAGDLRAA